MLKINSSVAYLCLIQEWNDDLGNLAQMWSDKCEWKHGFTKFGAWHPSEAFRSKTVGKKQTTMQGLALIDTPKNRNDTK